MLNYESYARDMRPRAVQVPAGPGGLVVSGRVSAAPEEVGRRPSERTLFAPPTVHGTRATGEDVIPTSLYGHV